MRGWPAVAALLACSWPFPAIAQVVPQQQINFSPPGARALAMGGTFIGLADDATASESNPAGLVVLSRPEISVHVRGATYETPRPSDVILGDIGKFTDAVWSPAFFSFAAAHRPLTVAVFYHEPSKFRSHSFFDGVRLEGPSAGDFRISESETDLLLSKYGFAAAYRLHPRLAVGGSISGARGHRRSLDRLRIPAQEIEQRVSIDSVKYDVTWSAGAIVNPGRRISAGFVFKGGPTFAFDTTRFSQTGPRATVQRLVVERQLPTVWGAGVAARPAERLTLLLDLVHVGYSSLNAPTTAPGLDRLENGLEVHVGGEYVHIFGQTPVAFRGGLFTDPDHDVFPEVDSDQMHGTAGVGFVLEGRFQIDFGANVSSSTKELILSTVYRF